MRFLSIGLLVSAIFFPRSDARAQGGEDPGDDGGGPQKCWNCVDEIRDGVTYHLCQYGSLVGFAGCIGGGSGTMSNCTNSATKCPATDDVALASSMVARDGFSTAGRRLTLAMLEIRPDERVLLRAVAALSDCKGYVVALARASSPLVSTVGAVGTSP